MNDLVQRLQSDNPSVIFTEGSTFAWSPQKNHVIYVNSDQTEGQWSLLHELSHALLGHTSYDTDIDLLQKEVEAWAKAASISTQYGVTIEQDFVEDCLDSYRDWLHKRSACPTCGLQGVQKTADSYVCLNCAMSWKVTKERLCRPYRRSE